MFSKTNNLVAATVAAAAIAAASAPATAQQTLAYTTGPIRVVSYSIEPTRTITVPAWAGTYMNVASSGKVTISFVDTGTVPATAVQFAVRSGKTIETIVDKGTFSPGASVTHNFSLGSEFGSASALDVERVTFADGTSWERN
jgi:hypothetical protein